MRLLFFLINNNNNNNCNLFYHGKLGAGVPYSDLSSFCDFYICQSSIRLGERRLAVLSTFVAR